MVLALDDAKGKKSIGLAYGMWDLKPGPFPN
jgi:hypothetical protein